MKNNRFFQLEKHLVSLFANALKNKVFSGASAAVFFREKGKPKRLIISYGRTMFGEGGENISNETLFDLASLTKPLCTVLCILSLMEEGRVHWSTELTSVFKDQTGPYLKNIKIEQLLSHSAGLIEYRPFYEDFTPVFSQQARDKLLERILQEPLAYEPGTRCLYSDLGFILLGETVERITKTGLNKYFTEKVSGPLQLDKSLFFKPLAAGGGRKSAHIAATEICPWRKRLLQGEVHDEHCWLMGGVAGHAGLFGTAEGVLTLTEHILNQWQGRGGHMSFSAALLREALNRKHPGGTWALGFDRPALVNSSAGRYMSKTSVGHFGYTGTSFWIDPVRDVVAVLLTNRVHPTRKNEKIKKFRPLFHDTVIKMISGK